MINIKSHITITPQKLSYKGAAGEEIILAQKTDGSFLKTIYKQLDISYPKFYKMDGLSRLGFLGAEFLLQTETTAKDNCDLLFINKHSSLAVDTAYQESLLSLASPALFVYTLPNIVQGEICIRHKIFGENYMFVEANFSAESLFEKAKTILDCNEGNNLLLACLDFENEHHYELHMFLLVNSADNQAIKFNLQNLKTIFDPL